jgi:HPt (histidine-containing phosphotransfer) domain-containing protein
MQTINQAQQLAMVNALGAPARALIEHFFGSLDERLSALSSAFADNNIAEVGHVAHRLKGASAVYGAEALARLAGQIEARADAADTQALVPLIAALKPTADATRADTRQLLECAPS